MGMKFLSSGTSHLVAVNQINTVRNDVASIVTYAASISDAIKAIAVTDDPAEKRKILDGIGETRKAYKEKLDEVGKFAAPPEGQQLLAALKDGLATGKVTNQKLIDLGMSGDRDGFVALYKNEGRFTFVKVRDAGNALDSYYRTLAEASAGAAVRSNKSSELTLILFSLVALGASFAIAVLFTRSITAPIGRCVAVADRLADGDLTVVIDVKGEDEISHLMQAMGNMTSHMKKTIGALNSTSREVSAAATDLHVAARQMVDGADRVAEQSHAVAVAGEEMAATSSDIANSCHVTADNADQANAAAMEGAQVVERSMAAMGTIADRVRSVARTVSSLGGRSEQIGEIIGTIEDIADQTNLLALNAAIEAARAGEQGRGFAVVADEVRALAERTTKATREIGEMIKAIQNETKGAVAAMEEGVIEVERGTQEAANSSQALEAILTRIGEVTMQANQMATAAEEQTATTAEISCNMQQITGIVNDSARTAQETEAAADKLSQLADELHGIVGQFKLAV